MKNKINFKNILSVLLVVFISIFMLSCSRDEATAVNELGTDEEVIEKGHDNWARVEVIIRQGHLHGADFHGNPEMKDRPIIPIIQKVIFEQTSTGIKRTIDKGNSLKKDQEVIEIIASPKEGARYSMELIYYNASGERINYQYMTPEQLPIHQHFFTVKEYEDIKTKNIFKATSSDYFTNLYSYVYRDTNPEDQMVGQGGSSLIKNNPVGLKGYFHFKKESNLTRFNMRVHLAHFKSSKFNKDGKADEANNPSRRVRLASVTDFAQEIPFVVIGYDGITDEEVESYLQDVADYYGITTDEVEEYLIQSDADPESGSFWM